MKILGNRVLVSKVEEPVSEGFQAVAVQDSFVYKGKVEQVGQIGFDRAGFGDHGAVHVDGSVKEGDIILFAKYSPDTQEVDYDGQKMKIISVPDILAIL